MKKGFKSIIFLIAITAGLSFYAEGAFAADLFGENINTAAAFESESFGSKSVRSFLENDRIVLNINDTESIQADKKRRCKHLLLKWRK